MISGWVKVESILSFTQPHFNSLGRDRVTTLPLGNRLTRRSGENLDRAGLREWLHEILNILFVFRLDDPHKSVLTINHSIAENIHAELACIFLIHMLDQ